MVRIENGEVKLDDGERMARISQEARNGWGRMTEDMRAMAADREEAGYETLSVPAGDTTPKPPGSGDTDEWGLSYIIPGNKADDFLELYERADFDETGVYQASMSGISFIVTECLDHDEEIALFVAGSYRLQFAAPLVRTALERDRMFTHIKKLDGTHLGTIEHDDPDAFFPNPEEIYAYETDL